MMWITFQFYSNVKWSGPIRTIDEFPAHIPCQTQNRGDENGEPESGRHAGNHTQEEVSVTKSNMNPPNEAINEDPESIKNERTPINKMCDPGPVPCLQEQFEADSEKHRCVDGVTKTVKIIGPSISRPNGCVHHGSIRNDEQQERMEKTVDGPSPEISVVVNLSVLPLRVESGHAIHC